MGCNHVQKILSDMRYAIDNKKFYPINRRKNLDTLAHLGISWDAAKEEIYDLKEEDYKSGPSVDRDDPSSDHFWVFKKKVDGNSIYIKFLVKSTSLRYNKKEERPKKLCYFSLSNKIVQPSFA